MAGVPYKIWGRSGNRQVIRFDPDSTNCLQIKDGGGGEIIFPIADMDNLIRRLLEFEDTHLNTTIRRKTK